MSKRSRREKRKKRRRVKQTRSQLHRNPGAETAMKEQLVDRILEVSPTEDRDSLENTKTPRSPEKKRRRSWKFWKRDEFR